MAKIIQFPNIAQNNKNAGEYRGTEPREFDRQLMSWPKCAVPAMKSCTERMLNSALIAELCLTSRA